MNKNRLYIGLLVAVMLAVLVYASYGMVNAGKKESYYSVADHICTVNFAAQQNGVTCYPDLIKVSVAMDNGSIVLLVPLSAVVYCHQSLRHAADQLRSDGILSAAVPVVLTVAHLPILCLMLLLIFRNQSFHPVRPVTRLPVLTRKALFLSRSQVLQITYKHHARS